MITYASGDLGAAEVKRVTHEPEAPYIKLPEHSAIDDEIWVPRDPRPDRRSYKAYFEAGLGHEIDQDELDAFMRQRRLKGIPLGDDPLRDLVLVIEDDKSKTLVLDELAKQAT